jgi:ribosomal protein S18 acetylase RimI-like enzyme
MKTTTISDRPVLVAMTESDYKAFAAEALPAYAADKVASGEWTQEDSAELSRKSFAELLPQGFATPDMYFFTIRNDDDNAVGVLWIAAKQRGAKRIAYVYNVSVAAGHRRRGHASRAFRMLEDEARKLGLEGIALHVFGHNPVAQALYAKLGYEATNINMYKPVRPVEE